ncbi:hypothetical protein CLFO_27100 [Clostridium formicaceticum]|uniref:Uncharacterized protein n=1 Tax=Clostridium formicaceticum TaxID=1497 RepID=A0AAC9RJM2_9CLOT|nr:hypothetical protein CLFO_27100 [Clostridium formicaceticum]
MKDDKIYLIHIIESIRSIESYIEPGESEFFRSKLIQDAVIRNYRGSNKKNFKRIETKRV